MIWLNRISWKRKNIFLKCNPSYGRTLILSKCADNSNDTKKYWKKKIENKSVDLCCACLCCGFLGVGCLPNCFYHKTLHKHNTRSPHSTLKEWKFQQKDFFWVILVFSSHLHLFGILWVILVISNFLGKFPVILISSSISESSASTFSKSSKLKSSTYLNHKSDVMVRLGLNL